MGTVSKGPVFLLVLALMTNFLIMLFSCDIRNLFKVNIYLKWIIGYAVLFFVVFLGNYEGHYTIKYVAGISVFYYVWFIALMKVHPNIFFIVMLILSAGFMTDLYIEHHHKHIGEKKLAMYKDVHTWANYIAIFITALGFAHYYNTTDKKNISDLIFNTSCTENR